MLQFGSFYSESRASNDPVPNAYKHAVLITYKGQENVPLHVLVLLCSLVWTRSLRDQDGHF